MQTQVLFFFFFLLYIHFIRAVQVSARSLFGELIWHLCGAVVDHLDYDLKQGQLEAVFLLKLVFTCAGMLNLRLKCW